MIPLFREFPGLQAALPYLALGDFPTPVHSWPQLEAEARVGALYGKCDDVTGPDYGGNKVRKLEFLLAAAQARGARSVLTFGAAGSNHALATAIYARKLGLQPISMLVPQPTAESVRRNLLRGHAAGASLHHFTGRALVSRGTVEQVVALRRETGGFPFIIPAGGSSPLGAVGFVNAALELRDQVEAGLLPRPDALYVASGTMGTCVGLLLGLAVAGLKSRVVAVRVTSAPFTSPEKARRLFTRVVGLLRRADPTFPAIPFPEGQFALRDGFLGAGYDRPTEAGAEAVARAAALEGIQLEGTYTGKALACLLADAASGNLAGQQVLFWNTYNSRSQESAISGLDYHQLPEPFHPYFEETVGAPDH